MLILGLYLGFYLFGMLIARWVTTLRQAVVSGVATTVAAGVAVLTLWLLTAANLIEPWVAIAMTGTIALPAAMIGLGLLAGSWIRRGRHPAIAIAVGLILPAMLLVALLT